MNIIVYGYGLMGQKVAQAVRNNDKMNLVGVVSPVFNEKIVENMYESLQEVHEKVDAIIDFSHPNNLDDILKFGIKNHCALVIATTGFNDQQKLRIEEASSQIPIFQSYNTSFGVSMLTKIVKEVAKEFYDQGYDIEIIEKHHNQKIDAPSGTAKLLYDVIHEDIDETKEVYDRSQVHHKREKSEIGIQSVRAGTIFGEHTVLFAGHDEIIEVKHTALSKEVFVQGAISACEAIIDKDNGLFTLKNLY
ncbi:4-hydroxy-tetrahydrodipicolinate reductase [Candidatus Stoquefichus massiliensis]|uniref:4-hydroxy-tetrahydrodipicolinate reductase n=1 Tax=Candidatus Stoquefichus massiliensis TaxID=1470350 RepID=UPI00048991D1|nr:4-hydroxy-tetrahydrodipicolinate reductase [Candidatus Stoquefichus massiliensis]